MYVIVELIHGHLHAVYGVYHSHKEVLDQLTLRNKAKTYQSSLFVWHIDQQRK